MPPIHRTNCFLMRVEASISIVLTVGYAQYGTMGLHSLMYFTLPHSFEVGIITIHILHMRKQRQGNVESLAQDPMATG